MQANIELDVSNIIDFLFCIGRNIQVIATMEFIISIEIKVIISADISGNVVPYISAVTVKDQIKNEIAKFLYSSVDNFIFISYVTMICIFCLFYVYVKYLLGIFILVCYFCVVFGAIAYVI